MKNKIKELGKKIFGNKKVVGSTMGVWVVVSLPLYLIYSIIVGIGLVVAYMRDTFAALFGRREHGWWTVVSDVVVGLDYGLESIADSDDLFDI